MKTALMQDILVKKGGAERVLGCFSELFADAPIYTALYDEKVVGKTFPKEKVITSSLQWKYNLLGKKQRFFINKIPLAVEEFDFSGFDLVLTSSTAFSHGIIPGVNTRHICYCHSPMRYAWDYYNEYKKDLGVRPGGIKDILVSSVISRARFWDSVSSDRVDLYIANSRNVAARIKKFYKLDSVIVYPPVDVARFKPNKNHEDYFLIVSTIAKYKRIDPAISLFNKINRRLVIIGEGADRARLMNMAEDNIEFLVRGDDDVTQYMQNCRAFIFPGEDDFGITPVEAMACGKPVLAYGKGGALETVIPGVTGEFFFEQNLESMEQGLIRLLENEAKYDYKEIRRHAELFSRDRFMTEMKAVIDKVMNN